MKNLAMAGVFVLGILLLVFHTRLTQFQMAIYRRSLPAGWASGTLRASCDLLVILIGVIFVAVGLSYLLGYLR